MRTLLLHIGFIFTSCLTYAQNASLVWAKPFSGGDGSTGNAIAVDKKGNVISAGRFKGFVDFDPGPGTVLMSANGTGTYISKLDSNGNFVWVRQFSGPNVCINALAVDTAGNVYTTGLFQGITDFDPGPGAYNFSTVLGSNVFVSKLDKDGNFVWAKQFSGPASLNSIGFGIGVDEAGNVYTTGQFDANVDFDPGPSTHILVSGGFEDMFICKLDINGNYVWAKQFGSVFNETAYALALDQSDNILITGYYQGDIDFPTSTGPITIQSAGSIDAFVAKFTPDGICIWAKDIGGTDNDSGSGIAADAAGNVFCTGYFSGTCDFNSVGGGYLLNSAGIGDIYIAKYLSNGSFAWADRMGGPEDDHGFGISVDETGSVYTIGYFKGTADFDPGIGTYSFTSRGGYDIFMSKLDNSGSFLWAKHIGGIMEDIGYAITTNEAGNIYSTGYFANVVDMDPGLPVFNLTALSVNDIYVHKMRKCTNSVPVDVTAAACFSYNFNGHILTASGTYKDTLQNSGGCDSIVTLHLTVNGSIKDSTASACETFNWEGQTLTSSGNYTVTYSGSGGCDSILRLNLTIYHKVATNVVAAICQGQQYAGHASAGVYVDTYQTVHGCDSVRTLILTIKPVSTSDINATICDGQLYFGHGTAGLHVDTLVSVNGCDSLRRLHLAVLPRSFTTIVAGICQGQAYFAAGHLQTLSGNYYDTLTNSIGCDSIITTQLTVHPLPQPNLGPDRNLCSATGAAFISPGNFISYLWQDNSIASAFSVNTPGKYWVKVTDQYNCINSDTLNVSAIDTLPHDFLPPDQTICMAEVLPLKIQGYHNYLWSDGTRLDHFVVKRPGIYSLSVTDSHNCTGNDNIEVNGKDCFPVGIPNSFTPNNDGKNDVFKPVINQTISLYFFAVFNRFGEQVFVSGDYTKGWDGTLKGKQQGQGTYVYYLKYTNYWGEISEYRGTVLLLR